MSPALPNFIGLQTQYETADGTRRRRLHMDGAASPLAAQTALEAIQDLLPHYSNTHSHVHHSAQISSQAFRWAHEKVLGFVGADNTDYTAVFMGAGATAAINRIARGLHFARPDKNVVLVSAMEHHANDLPHRQFDNEVHYIALQGNGSDQGAISLDALEALLIEHGDKVNYIAFSAVSNVTGIVNPVAEITELAHKHGVLVLVDAAQAVAHQQIELSNATRAAQVDFMIFSGHKLYCPTAPGVLVARKTLLEELQGQDLGGGAVVDVSYYDYELSTLPDREQAGTPNIVGAIALARVMDELQHYGQETIQTHNTALIEELSNALNTLPHIKVYGSAQAARVGALALNHESINHGLLAAILNDYYQIAVRNECFCAHPYVSSLLKEELWQIDLSNIEPALQETVINQKRGMVRVSMSLYNSSADIERLVQALIDIDRRIEHLSSNYDALPDGNYRHKQYRLNWRDQLGWQ